jgi:CheY-like chemotaxis protein
MADASHNRTREIGTALVVEDDPVARLALCEALRDAGARSVASCATMHEALAALDQLRPDVVVLDVRLADRHDGWALAEMFPLLGPRVPQVIFATASPQDIPPAVAALGSVLTKPFTAEELLARISDLPGPSLVGRLREAFSGES